MTSRWKRGRLSAMSMRNVSLFIGFWSAAIGAMLGGCSGVVTQDPPDDPSGMMDASAGTGGMDAGVAADSGDVSDSGMSDGGVVSDASPGMTGIGAACTTNAECEMGNQCYIPAPGGYCTLFCTNNDECPAGSVCSPIPLSRVSGACMKTCGGAADCRNGYACAVVYLFPGDVNSPSSKVPVCWTPPP